MLPSKSTDNKTSSENNQANEEVRNPNDNTPVIPQNTDSHPIIPVNAADSGANNKLMCSTVSVECLSEHTSTNVKEQTGKSAVQSVSAVKSGYSMRVRQTPKKVTHCTSRRKRAVVDYSQYDTSTDPPSPPKWHRKVDLKRKPSKIRIAAKKYKNKTPGRAMTCAKEGYTLSPS